MASLAKIREIEEQNRRLEELNSRPSIESRLEQLRIEELKLHKSDIELEKRKKDNSGNRRLVEEIDRELAENREIFELNEEEYHHLKESITNPNPTIDGVFQCLHDTIHNLLQFLHQILDSIRSIVLDSSQEFTFPEMLMNKISHYPPELSKLVGMLFIVKYDDDYDDYDFTIIFQTPILEEKKRKADEKFEQRMDYILSQLEPIFLSRELSQDFLSDINIFLTIFITNCDDSGVILNTKEVSEKLISDFLSDSECDILTTLLKLDFHRLFFKALGHPRIVKYLEENLIPEKNRRYFCDVFPDSVSRIESFLGNVQADYIHMKHFQEIVEYLNKISNTFGL
jgi:hypothetical protein